MTAKRLPYREDARDRIRRGVDAPADAVKVTRCPRGRNMILDRGFSPPQIVNSGVGVAKAIARHHALLAVARLRRRPRAAGQPLAQARLVKAKTLRSLWRSAFR